MRKLKMVLVGIMLLGVFCGGCVRSGKVGVREVKASLEAEVTKLDNAADDYLEAVRLYLLLDLIGHPAEYDKVLWEGWKEEHKGLENYLVQCKAVIKELRKGIEKEYCMMPEVDIDEQLPYLVRFKDFARLLLVEGRYFEWKGDYVKALQNYTDVLKFGQDIARGGQLIHKLVNIAIEAMGCRPLGQSLKTRVENASVYKELLKRLDGLEGRAVSLAEILQTESVYGRKLLKLILEDPAEYEKLRQRLGDGRLPERPKLDAVRKREIMAKYDKYFELLVETSKKPHLEVVKVDLKSAIPKEPILEVFLDVYWGVFEKNAYTEMEAKAIKVVVALQFYKALHGRYPDRLKELVPDCLKELPIDPFSGKPFKYVKSGDSWIIYSFGPDLADDGGKVKWDSQKKKGDVIYN